MVMPCRAAAAATAARSGGPAGSGGSARACAGWPTSASYQALSLDGVRFVPVIGHQLTLQVAWAAGNTNTALPGFLHTARQIAGQTIPAGLMPGQLPSAEP